MVAADPAIDFISRRILFTVRCLMLRPGHTEVAPPDPNIPSENFR